MITGVGIDSIEIARVGKACTRPGSRFAEKMFTALERERSARRKFAPYEHLAACFAAREAFFKATQVHYRRQEVSVAQRPSGELMSYREIFAVGCVGGFILLSFITAFCTWLILKAKGLI